MKLYRLVREEEQFGTLVMDGGLLKNALGRKILLNFTQLSENIDDKWPEVQGWFQSLQNDELIEDKPALYLTAHMWLVLSERAKKLLESELRKVGEYLPFDCVGEPYYLLVPHNIIPVDKKESQHYLVEGMEHGTKKVKFRDEDVGLHCLFKTDFDYGLNLYCSERFKQTVEKHQLAGVCFETELARVAG